MKSHVWQCLLTFVLAVAIDVIGGLHFKTLISNAMAISVATVIFSHYLAFLGLVFFVDEKSNAKRFSLTTAAALGAGLGTAIVILCF